MRERRIDGEDILLVEVDASDPSIGHEVVEQRGQRHWRGPTEPIWVRIGVNDPWADNTTHPLPWFFTQYRVLPEQAMRITAYRHFPHRDTDKAIVEYDLLVVNTIKGPHVDQYDSHDQLLQANAAAQSKLAEEGEEGTGRSVAVVTTTSAEENANADKLTPELVHLDDDESAVA